MNSRFSGLEDIKIKSFDLNPCPLVVVNDSLEIVAINEHANELFGYNEGSLITQHVETLIPESFRAKHTTLANTFLECPQKRAMGAGRDLFALTKSGKLFPVEIGLNPVREKNDLFILISIVDISRRKDLEKELIEKNETLLQINYDLNSFANIAAHDLKSPLNTIIGFIDLIKKKMPQGTDPLILNFLTRIKDSSRRLEYLIKKLLEFSKIESSFADRERVSLNAVLNDVLSDLSDIIEKNNAKVDFDPLPEVTAVEIHLYQIFQNLLSNAIKFKKKDAHPFIQIRTETEGSHHKITFSDNGQGFDQKHVEKIFRPFERLVSNDEVEGAGIGLATVKKLVERNGGTLSAEGTPGRGAVFTLTFPK